jgi:hypothetical protein
VCVVTSKVCSTDCSVQYKEEDVGVAERKIEGETMI